METSTTRWIECIGIIIYRLAIEQLFLSFHSVDVMVAFEFHRFVIDTMAFDPIKYICDFSAFYFIRFFLSSVLIEKSN